MILNGHNIQNNNGLKINLIDFLLSANSHLSLHLYITIYNKPQTFNIKGTLINKCITIFVISLNQI
jgi:hypothetical protein